MPTRKSPRNTPDLKIHPKAILPRIKKILETPELTTAARVFFAYIALSAGTKGTAWPRNQTIADAIGMKERTIQYAIKELIAEGLLASVTVNQGRKGRRYLSPWPSRIDELITQLQALGFTILGRTILRVTPAPGCGSTTPAFDDNPYQSPIDTPPKNPRKIKVKIGKELQNSDPGKIISLSGRKKEHQHG